MQYMMQHKNAMQMMGNMMHMMESDSTYCDMMSRQMMNNAQMKRMMQNMCQQNGNMMGSLTCPMHKK